MLRYLTKTGTQCTSDITLLAEAQGVTETFQDTLNCFGTIANEIEDISRNGLNINGYQVRILFYFTGDLKIL